MSFQLTSTSFSHEGEIPKQYTCEGEDISVQLAWSGAPEGTRSYALIADDPDAPDPEAPKMVYVHWVLYNIPADAGGLAENIAPEDLPKGTLQGLNDWKRTGYGGPCPPTGDTPHHYVVTVWALDTERLPVNPDSSGAMVGFFIHRHQVAKAEITLQYGR